MIIFNTIRWKNFLSTGNQFTEIKLDRSPSTLIVGENGGGKSTMLDALCFSLFGKPFRNINKPQLVNSINKKQLLVEVEFHSGSKLYKIVRGIKPGLFEIYADGELLNQDAAARDYQKYLEESILKLNYKSFTQIVILGSASFTPFMQLPSGTRREIIEDLLDIQIFTTMNVVLRDSMSTSPDCRAVKRCCAFRGTYLTLLASLRTAAATAFNASIEKFLCLNAQSSPCSNRLRFLWHYIFFYYFSVRRNNIIIRSVSF